MTALIPPRASQANSSCLEVSTTAVSLAALGNVHLACAVQRSCQASREGDSMSLRPFSPTQNHWLIILFFLFFAPGFLAIVSPRVLFNLI